MPRDRSQQRLQVFQRRRRDICVVQNPKQYELRQERYIFSEQKMPLLTELEFVWMRISTNMSRLRRFGQPAEIHQFS
jgi:hypothetical protein